MVSAPGHRYVVAIGIDRYRSWPQLGNAVQDARGATAAFERLGFQSFCPPILDDQATGATLQRLAKDGLSKLGANDSLVVFFAGHGDTLQHTYPDGMKTTKGFIIPVDAEAKTEPVRTSSWLRLDDWLRDLAHLPPRHLLVILDACRSGVALDPVVRWRGEDMRLGDSFEALRGRRSRRVITSALGDQQAMDGGPIAGHSLFTGCLIEGLSGGLSQRGEAGIVTGSQLGLYVQQRVASYPHTRQTPDFGALELDARGELILELAPAVTPTVRAPDAIGADSISIKRPVGDKTAAPARHLGADGIRVTRPSRPERAVPPPSVEAPATPIAAAPALQPPALRPADAPTPLRLRCAPPSQAFIATLDRHERYRRQQPVVSLIAAEPLTASTAWATWCAGKGRISLLIDQTGVEAAIEATLASMPWLRVLATARHHLAGSAGLAVAVLDDALDHRSGAALERWLEELTEHDLHARVGGWLLSALRQPLAATPDLFTAPVRGGDLLTILSDFAAPVSVLFQHAAPTVAWIAQAIDTAYALAEFIRCPIAVAAPRDAMMQALKTREDMHSVVGAHQWLVPLPPQPSQTRAELGDTPAQVLCAALERDARTRGLFHVDAHVPTFDHQRVAVDLAYRDALLAIEIDDWYHYRDPQACRRDRIKDVWLQRAGFFVMRFVAEDIDNRLPHVIDEIALGLAGRRASGSLLEKDS